MCGRKVPAPGLVQRYAHQEGCDATDQVAVLQAERQELSPRDAAQYPRLPRHQESCEDACRDEHHELRRHRKHQQRNGRVS